MTKANTTTKKKTTTKKTSTKKTTTKKLAKKRSTDLNLFVYNENCELEIMKVPIKYRMDFVYRFGVMSAPSKERVIEWLESIKSVEI